MEIVFFIGAAILLTALIYGSLSYRHRNRAAEQAGEQIVRDRYRHDQTWKEACAKRHSSGFGPLVALLGPAAARWLEHRKLLPVWGRAFAAHWARGPS